MLTVYSHFRRRPGAGGRGRPGLTNGAACGITDCMNYPEHIDMHLHSTVSDGTDTPEELLACVREAGMGMFSLTDHDALKGCSTILRARKASDPVFVPGIEISCRDEGEKYHILAYGYDPEALPLGNLARTCHEIRMNKVRRRLDFLKEQFGMSFPEEEVETLLARDNPGKPHIANLMVRYGFVPTKEVGIKEYLNKLHIKSEYIRPETAIRSILGSGGIPVLAHPSYGTGDEIIVGEEMEQRIRHLKGFGLKGLEAFYSGFTDLLIQENLGYAEKYDLYVTAGSDYHGKNKLVRIGDTNLPSVSEAPERLKQFVGTMLERFA